MKVLTKSNNIIL